MPKRSLILAGGGMKVAFQAGVLQVWLDEAKLEFDHVDGASGGVFNLAMLCQGMSGTEIADNWRDIPALAAVQLNWRAYLRPLTAESLARLDRFRRRIFPAWGLDFDAIRACRREATFNSYNFTRHELAVMTPDQMTEDLLISCVSLPMWFPPVRVNGETYVDAVYITDANLEEAIRRGADEIWVIWTVSERSEWRGGFLGHYFAIIETAANGHFRRIVRRIEESNAAIERGEAGEFGRRIDLRVLRAEVPLHYLLNFNSDRFREAVERGVHVARRWCEEQGIEVDPVPRRRAPEPVGLRLSEKLRGQLSGEPVALRLEIAVDDVDAFIADPSHEAWVAGRVESPALGGARSVERGVVHVLTDDGDPSRKEIRYSLRLTDAAGRPRTITGVRRLDGASGRRRWEQATALDLAVFDGDAADGSEAAALVAEGRARAGAADVIRQLASVRATGRSAAARRSAVRRAGALLLGSLWDVYARRLLPVSPV
jgi:predicted acylesterase/phospholipase RssA